MIDIKIDIIEIENVEKIYFGFILDDFIILLNGVNVYIWYIGYCVMKEFFVMIRDSEMIIKREVKFVDLFFLFLVGICVIVEGWFFVFVIDIIVENELFFICNLLKKSVVIFLLKRGKIKKMF